jgi:UDPglucose--hexose-1-phosphate uridylyltransferase
VVQGQTEEPVRNTLPAYDEKCYLCPRNARMGGAVNPPYKDTFVSWLLWDDSGGRL